MATPLTAQRIAHLQRLAESYQRLTGRLLVPAGGPERVAQAIEQAPFVVLSHGTEPDPILNYGNATALALWEMDLATLCRTPSRLTAEAPAQEARERVMAAVARDGFIDGYSGVRISASGRRFRIEQVTIWNIVDAAGNYHGQAATFPHWSAL